MLNYQSSFADGLEKTLLLLEKKYIDNPVFETLCKKIGVVQGYDLYICEDNNRLYYMALDSNKKVIAAIGYHQKPEQNYAELFFGGVAAAHRGQKLTEQMINASIDHDAQESNKTTIVCTGSYSFEQAVYIGKKIFESGKCHVWICDNISQISDENKVINFNDYDSEKLVMNKSARIFVTGIKS